jgi:hypothetical protein
MAAWYQSPKEALTMRSLVAGLVGVVFVLDGEAVVAKP